MKLKADTNSYMQLSLHLDEETLYLFVPTYFDATRGEWMGFVHLREAKKMIQGIGKNSKELEQSFNDKLREHFEGPHSKEVFSLFKPLSYWEEMREEQ